VLFINQISTIQLFIVRQPFTHNDLRANEGRETKALNCKPNTNLKEKTELSNYCKTSGFRLHAVMCSFNFHLQKYPLFSSVALISLSTFALVV
jgi:hypothetical protein